MSKRLRVVALSIFVVVLLLTGCGGSGSSDPLTKAEFIREATSICRSADSEQDKALRDAAGGDPELSELTVDALSPVESMTEELGELNPPPGDTKEVNALIEALEAGAAKVKANPADPAISTTAFAEANDLAEAYGLAECIV
jgi:hypothetical protein